MRTIIGSLRNNRIVILWLCVFILFLLFSGVGKGEHSRSLINTIWSYWNGGEWKSLTAGLAATLSVAFPVTVAILFISLFFACLSYRRPRLSPYLTLIMGMSMLPTVYFIFLIKIITVKIPVDNRFFLLLVLTFSNLIPFFFYIGFRKEIYEEFEKEYHSFTRLLGVDNIMLSAAKKVSLIMMERFKTLFILIFSSTIFAEHKLAVSSGIYSLFYKTTMSMEGRQDIFYGQLAFILLFVVLFLIVYDICTIFLKMRYY